ncbi:helix-turn-helix domain-containing protein [Muribaculum caecicola]|uniref:Helix-turn-helix domain-containing protein n=1 Tax=Muribaculum caecicola TaxID=3038144 RepID=A0AC61S813_9BACT|nr:helix-turn-helix domain-containing protein [Muribaculum caecicola]THG54905.1 helix-turn-helix domain-containing protein [Muribaculum caecicola]
MGKKRTSAISNQMEKVLSMMVSEKPLERILSLENRITDIHTHIRQMKEQIWDIKEVLTTAEASAYLGLSESYIYKLTSTKQIPHYKPNGKLVYFNRKELCEWAMRNQIETTGTNDPIDSETL